MMYKIKSIPTPYKGVRYRSRLEARWAAFFDVLGWRASYEPFDLGQWSPDFLVRTDCIFTPNKRLIAEVKPFDLEGVYDRIFEDINVLLPVKKTLIKMKGVEYDRTKNRIILLGLEPFNRKEALVLGLYYNSYTDRWGSFKLDDEYGYFIDAWHEGCERVRYNVRR